MIKEIDLIKIKILSKWLHDMAEEITNNKSLINDDIIVMLLSMKNTIDEIDKIIAILISENTTSQKS